jgi:hypothetical protein
MVSTKAISEHNWLWDPTFISSSLYISGRETEDGYPVQLYSLLDFLQWFGVIIDKTELTSHKSKLSSY